MWYDRYFRRVVVGGVVGDVVSTTTRRSNPLEYVKRHRRHHSQYIYRNNYQRRAADCYCCYQRNWSVVTAAVVTTAATLLLSSSIFIRAMSTAVSSTTSSGIAKPTTTIAVGQVCSTSSKWNNLVNIAMCAGWATSAAGNNNKYEHADSTSAFSSSNDCSMLFLPECVGFLGSNAEETLRAAEPSSSLLSLSATMNPESVRQQLITIVQKCSQGPRNVIPPNMMNVSMPEVDVDEWQLSIMDGLRVIAQASQLWISAGSVHIHCPDDDENDDDVDDDESTSPTRRRRRRVYNTHVIMDDMGKIRSKYRKIHLFDVSLPEQKVHLQESATTRAGTELVVCSDSPIGCLGLSVCYDLRFPELYTQLVQTMGAQILLVPSAFTVPTGRAHWHTLLRARAIENQCYVIAAAQYGPHNEKRVSYGHSLVVDGWGTIIADSGGMDHGGTMMMEHGNDDGDTGATTTTTTTAVKPPITTSPPPPTIIICNIDLSTIDSIRKRMPIQQHRRNAQT